MFSIFPKWFAGSLLIIISFFFWHDGSSWQAIAKAQNIAAPQFEFKTIQASVTGAENQPVARFTATVRLIRHQNSSQPELILAKLNCKGEDGRLQIQLAAPAQNEFQKAALYDQSSGHDRHWVVLEVFAAGHIDRCIQIAASKFTGQFPDCQLREAIKMVGRFKTAKANQVTGPITGRVEIIEKLGALPSAAQYNQQFSKSFALNADGSFESWVPKSCNLFLVAQTMSSSPLRLTASSAAPNEADASLEPVIDIGQHSLLPGVTIKGIVVDRDNSPMDRQIVQLYQPRSDLQFTDTSIRHHAETNSLGQFEFPPCRGKVEISLVREGTTIDGRHIKTPNAPLAATPMELDLELKPKTPRPFLEIKEARLHKVYGRIEAPEGIPASEFAIRLWRHQDTSSLQWIAINDNGTFDFDLIEGTRYRMEFRHAVLNQKHQALFDESTSEHHAWHFSDTPLVPTDTFRVKPLKNKMGPLSVKILKRKTNRK